MRVPYSPAVLACCAAALCAAILALPVWAGAEPGAMSSNEGTQAAVWTKKKVHFVYQGFTTHYSCEGLRDKVRKALLELGARKDLKVTEGACWHPAGGPEPFPNVDVTMSVLEPVSGSATPPTHASPTDTVPAHWQAIDLKLDTDPLWQAGDCELLEQINHTFLPLFATHAVDYHSTCAAHQVFPGGTWLRAQVLMRDQNAPNTLVRK